MKIKFVKLHENAVIPTKAHPTDAGFDLTATSRHFDEHGAVVYGTGIAMEIPPGYVGLAFPRSSVSKLDLSMANCVGVIDAGYRGEITLKFKPALLFNNLGKWNAPETTFVTGRGLKYYYDPDCLCKSGRCPKSYPWKNILDAVPEFKIEPEPREMQPNIYNVGERVAQLIIMPIPEIEFEETAALSEGERGANGYGSTGL